VTQLNRRPDMTWLLSSPSGRVGRRTFSLSWLFWMMLNGFSSTNIALHPGSEETLSGWMILFLITAIASLISATMVSIKRLHDIGYSGVFVLALFIPAVSFLVLLLLCIWPGEKQANKFGPATDWPAA